MSDSLDSPPPMTSSKMTAYLAPSGYLPELVREIEAKVSEGAGSLGRIQVMYDRLVLVEGPDLGCKWSQNTWLNPRFIEVSSISDAARKLRDIQRRWALYPVSFHRRAQLISEQLSRLSFNEIEFPCVLPPRTLGSWALVESNRMLVSSSCSSPFPNGEVQFLENKMGPPSRAYLKLWEALLLCGQVPRLGCVCLDMGSSPGGWTWALHELGASVISVDKAPLADSLTGLPRIKALKQDAFTLDPLSIGPVDWFFSDVICYPNRLLDLVRKWLATKLCSRFICTIKFQGSSLSQSDLDALRGFEAIEGSRVCHLSANKHELTWIKVS